MLRKMLGVVGDGTQGLELSDLGRSQFSYIERFIFRIFLEML
jgi:hypothetical protein